MPKDLYTRWKAAPDPLVLDTEVRSALDIPDNSYYSVGRTPPMEGQVMLTGMRVVKPAKISKSDQP